MDALMQLTSSPLAFILSVTLPIAALVTTAIISVRQAMLLKRYRMLLAGPTGSDLETLLLAQGEKIEQLKTDLTQLVVRVNTIEDKSKFHIQKSATVRFNAFPDTGSDLSFAIALLNAQDNGVVLSSLYGRSESRMYAKPITGGASTYALSDEEKAAIAKAIGET